MQTKYIFLVLLLFFCGCDYFKPPEYPEYDIPKTPNNSDKLRLDGYYYCVYTEGNLGVMLFYKNGVVLFLGSGTNFTFFEEQIFHKFNRNNIGWWGLYKICNDTIFYNNIYMDIDRKYKSNITKGIILNDTTFKEVYSTYNGGDFLYEKRIFRFRQYSPKPDSTNIFTDR